MDELESDKLYMSDPQAKTLNGFIVALNIFSRHMEKGLDTPFFSCAEHDVFYVSSEGPEEDSEDGRRLIALGWHWDDETDGWAYFT